MVRGGKILGVYSFEYFTLGGWPTRVGGGGKNTCSYGGKIGVGLNHLSGETLLRFLFLRMLIFRGLSFFFSSSFKEWGKTFKVKKNLSGDWQPEGPRCRDYGALRSNGSFCIFLFFNCLGDLFLLSTGKHILLFWQNLFLCQGGAGKNTLKNLKKHRGPFLPHSGASGVPKNLRDKILGYYTIPSNWGQFLLSFFRGPGRPQSPREDE